MMEFRGGSPTSRGAVCRHVAFPQMEGRSPDRPSFEQLAIAAWDPRGRGTCRATWRWSWAAGLPVFWARLLTRRKKPPGKSGGFLTNHSVPCGVVCRLGFPLRPLPGRPGEGGRGGWANQNNHW